MYFVVLKFSQKTNKQIGCSKSQLILKCYFGIFNSPKNEQKKEIPLVKFLFFAFWVNWRHQSHFEINWPLDDPYKNVLFIRLNIGIFTFSLISRVQWRIYVNIHITRSHFTFVKRGNVGRKFWRKGGLVSSNDFHQIRHSIFIRSVSS